MKRSIQILLSTVMIAIFFSCSQEEPLVLKQLAKDFPPQDPSTLHLQEKDHSAIDPEMQVILKKMIKRDRQQIIDQPEDFTRYENGSSTFFRKRAVTECCDISVVEAQNTQFVGAQSEHRMDPDVISWILVGEVYDLATNDLLTALMFEVPERDCDSTAPAISSFFVNAHPAWSYHQTCPGPPVIVELFLYKTYAQIQNPVLCAYARDILNLSLEEYDPSAQACLIDP